MPVQRQPSTKVPLISAVKGTRSALGLDVSSLQCQRSHTTCRMVRVCVCCCSAPAAEKPLDRVKWAAYIGAFFNKEYAANALYNTVRTNYMRLRRSALAQRGTPPVVCWVYKDWDGDYAMSYSKYKMEYVAVSLCEGCPAGGGWVWLAQAAQLEA